MVGKGKENRNKKGGKSQGTSSASGKFIKKKKGPKIRGRWGLLVDHRKKPRGGEKG